MHACCGFMAFSEHAVAFVFGVCNLICMDIAFQHRKVQLRELVKSASSCICDALFDPSGDMLPGVAGPVVEIASGRRSLWLS